MRCFPLSLLFRDLLPDSTASSLAKSQKTQKKRALRARFFLHQKEYYSLLAFCCCICSLIRSPIVVAPEDSAALLRTFSRACLSSSTSLDLTDRLMTRFLRSDRKSTRLNSSHVRISYAVFCLKKKTKT